jgi:hypothetical protein
LHLLRSTPFAPRNESPFRSALQKKSEMYTNLLSKSNSDFLEDIPLPRSVIRHLETPNPCLLEGNALGKITGFRIEVKGRKGSRSVRQLVSYGKIGSSDISKTCVDFAKSYFVQKKGASGVKVTIGYS